MRLTRTALVPVVAGLLLAGCGGTDDAPANGPDPADDTPTTQEPDDDTAGAGADDLDTVTEQVVADAAEAAGVDTDAVEVVTAEEVTWPDGALGCPEGDGMYTQALVEGYRIVVEIDGTEHHYHGGAGQAPFRCDDPQPPVDD